MYLEKKLIIEELNSRINEKLDFSIELKIETLTEDYDIIPDKCPKCSHIFEEIYCRGPEKSRQYGDFDLIVFKCSLCRAFYAYWIDCGGYSQNMGDPEPTENQPLKISGKPALYEKNVLFKGLLLALHLPLTVGEIIPQWAN